MFLVELVMQGVRGIRELARLRFQSGFNLVIAGNESGKTTSVDTVQRMLFPNNDPSAMAALVSRRTPDSSRGALVLCSSDGTYYRVIQDFSKRAVNLSKYNSTSKEFGLLYKDWDQTRQFLGGLTTGVSEEDYARIFLLRREQTAESGESGAPLPEPSPFSPQVLQPARPAAASGGPVSQAKAAELRETLRKAEEAADAEYRYQAAKLALETLKKKLSSLDEIEEKKIEIEATLAELKACEHLPENLSTLIEEQERRQSQKLTEADDLTKERDVLQMQYDAVPAVNVLTDKLFIAGIAIGVLSLLAGIFILTAEYGHFFYIGVIVALVLAAAALYNGSRKNAQRRMIKEELDALEKEIAALERKFVQESAAVTVHMRAVGAATLGELKERSDNYRHFCSLRDEQEEQRKHLLGDLGPEALREQYAKDQEEVANLEQAARALAPNNIDTYSIRQDIERLEGEAGSAAAAWDFGAPGQDAPPPVSPAPPAARGGVLAELSVASRVGGIEMETLIPAVEAAAQRNLSSITNGRYVRIEVGQEGEPVVHTRDEERVRFGELSHGTKALVTFCLRTGLVEAIVGKRRMPFLLDDALAGFDHQRQQAACQVLRTLGTKTQVVLFTSNSSLKAAGDAAAELK